MTAAILDIQNKIRRALEGPIYTAVKGAGIVLTSGEPAIQWGPMPFDRSNLADYFVVAVSFDHVIVHEMGGNPMIEGNGHVSISCRSQLKSGADRNDALARIVATAYPYASTPTFQGVAVFVDKATPRGYGVDGPYLTGLINVDWNIYRRP